MHGGSGRRPDPPAEASRQRHWASRQSVVFEQPLDVSEQMINDEGEDNAPIWRGIIEGQRNGDLGDGAKPLHAEAAAGR